MYSNLFYHFTLQNKNWSSIGYLNINITCKSYNRKKQMFLFNYLFGSNEKKPEAPIPVPKTSQDKIIEERIKMEASLNSLEVNIKKFEDTEKRLQRKVQMFKNKAVELISAGKNKEAKKYTGEVVKNQKQLDSYTLRKKVLLDKKSQLQLALMNMETIAALDTVSSHLTNQAQWEEKLSRAIEDSEEVKRNQKEIEDKLQNIVGNDSDEEENDELFKELLQEVEKKKMNKVENKKIVVNVPQKVSDDVDDIEKMLKNL